VLNASITLPLANRYLWPSLVVALLLSLVFILPKPFLSGLLFERDALDAGQLWRLISGQFIHLTLTHLILNIAGVMLIWLLFAEHTASWRYLWLLPLLALGSSTGMWLFAPQIANYVGFSGVLYGLFTWGALQDVMQRQPFARVLLFVIIAKASYEFIFSPLQFTPISANPLATAAHFFGVFSALLIGGIHYLFCGKLHRNT
jgi:rhomboid family GlyGly-CTERM serine protease